MGSFQRCVCVCACSFENIREIVLISASILYVIPFRHIISPGLKCLICHGTVSPNDCTTLVASRSRSCEERRLRPSPLLSVFFLIEPGGRAETTDQIEEEGDDTKNAALTLEATAGTTLRNIQAWNAIKM